MSTAAGTAEPLVKLSHIRKTYESQRGDVLAIDDIDFSVGDREFLVIVGASGCGKSTLLKIIAGLTPISGGEVLLRGRSTTSSDTGKPALAMVFQSPVLFKWKTVMGNLFAPIELMKLPVDEYREKARQLLERTGLVGFENHYPHELSGGMRQRVSICRSLIYDPEVILMDEPFGALDALTRDKLNFEIQRIWQAERKTVIFVTHSISEAVFLADRVVVLNKRPSTVREIVDIDLPRPRTLEMKTSEAFGRYTLQIYRQISEGFEE